MNHYVYDQQHRLHRSQDDDRVVDHAATMVVWLVSMPVMVPVYGHVHKKSLQMPLQPNERLTVMYPDHVRWLPSWLVIMVYPQVVPK